MDHYHKHQGSLPEKQLKKIIKAHYGDILGYKILGVEAEVIRDEVDVDFTTGGNPGRYYYVPPNQIWIENTMHPSDIMPVIVHEFVECHHMIEDGDSYDDAHDKANKHEVKIRKAIDAGKLKVKSFKDSVKDAAIYIEHVLKKEHKK